MKKTLALLLCALMLLSVSASAETLQGIAAGYGGEVRVTVTVENAKITAVAVEAPDETPSIGGKAVDEMVSKIIAANSADVDAVTGATYTSNAISAAVKNALDPVANPYVPEAPAVTEAPAVITDAEVYLGFGLANNGRIGPGKDDKEVQVYSINTVQAYVLFDKDGRILKSQVDCLEVATPNYDGASMPHFSGFPGQIPYNYDENHDEKVDGVKTTDDAAFVAEVGGWLTKRERGEGYVMNTGTWASQMDAFQAFFVGKTVDEIEAWAKLYTSDRNGRPLKDGSTNEQDAAKYATLSDADKAMLADVTSAATMSLTDSHGNIVAALRKAYDSRMPLSANAVSMGVSLHPSGRVGPGKDDKDVQVYSLNEVYAVTFFDADGRITASYVDQLEVATPNYDGASMPHFTGFPGQGGYNYDENHDEKVDSMLDTNDEFFQAEIAGWMTKRDRGEEYKMNTGTWTSQIDNYQAFFLGKTVDEIQEWFAKYTSDRNGRPLKDGSTNEQDAAKYATLTDEDKAMLADITTGATMSLNDSHGNLIGALRECFDNRFPIELTTGK